MAGIGGGGMSVKRPIRRQREREGERERENINVILPGPGLSSSLPPSCALEIKGKIEKKRGAVSECARSSSGSPLGRYHGRPFRLVIAFKREKGEEKKGKKKLLV